MRLVTDHTPGAYAVSVSCIQCGRRVLLADTFLDLDGPLFRAYYCVQCAAPLFVAGAKIAAPCRRPGCTRCGPHAYTGEPEAPEYATLAPLDPRD